MKRYFVLFLFFIPALVNGQKADSVKYYQQELSKISRSHQQALWSDSQYLALQESVRRLSAGSDQYRGFILYLQTASADFSRLNKVLSANGFTPLSSSLKSVGFGFTFKKNRRIFDLDFGAIGIAKKSEKGDEEVKVSFGSFLELVWGYDLIRSNMFNLYPYLGAGLRNTSLKYETKKQTDPSAPDFLHFAQNDRSISGVANELGYLAGLGAELVLTNSNRPGGTLVFARAGTNRAFRRKGFNLKGYPYDPQLEPGGFIVNAGFKFFFR